jgi:arylsulfatase A-like enzyme
MSHLSRRDFLKLSALLPTSMVVEPWIAKLASPTNSNLQGSPKNVIIFLFDAMSARNLSVYGYPRNTTPNFIRFAQRANVYHSHYSAGNFTTPGTTSLLTGLYPWTHRAINQSGLVARPLIERNIFRSFEGQHRRIAFAQNMWANYILSQFDADINTLLSPTSFSLANGIVGGRFNNDRLMGYRAIDDFLFLYDSTPASLLFGPAQKIYFLRKLAQEQNKYSQEYRGGLPNVEDYPFFFRLEDIFNGVISNIKNINTPTLAYFHFFPPHSPYRPSVDYFSMFYDKYQPVEKPKHPLGEKLSQKELNDHRRRYDQYIANIDNQFGHLLKMLEQSGFLDNSVIVVTADHGEMFERGVKGHANPMMYDPVVHIPLMISTPGQQSQNDIYEPTISVDVLPTLLHLANQPIPEWHEGALLPGLGGVYDPERPTFSVDAKLNPAFAPIKVGTLAMRKGPYKLIHYMGYAGHPGYSPLYNDVYELYNLEEDFEEMHDLYTKETGIAAQMKSEFLEALNKSNAQFHK